MSDQKHPEQIVNKTITRMRLLEIKKDLFNIMANVNILLDLEYNSKKWKALKRFKKHMLRGNQSLITLLQKYRD